MSTVKAKFCIGQMIHHKLFGYRGVIVEVDLGFKNSEEWYEMMARTRPPKNQPWYHVRVLHGKHMTYVAERNLEIDPISQN